MCGDPPNIIIGTSLGYSFGNFIRNTGIIALIALFSPSSIFTSASVRSCSKAPREGERFFIPIPGMIENKYILSSAVLFRLCGSAFDHHAQTGLTVVAIGVFIGAVSLITAGRRRLSVEKGGLQTLLFFIGLFIVVGGLEQTGILELIAGFIAKISGSNAMLMIAIVLWISAIASAFVDNIPFAATMVPVIKSLAAASGVDLSVLAWTLAMGTDIGGSATPIGASANVVGISVAAKEGHMIGWGKY
ncbi:MAG: SLC13 family permease [Eisenbergiella sp.]